MNVLHVMWGFSPWREGGLIRYAEELMQAEADEGCNVAAFFAGRRDFFGSCSLKRWQREKVRVYEIRNAPLVHNGNRGTFPPALELGEPLSERFFADVLDEVAPEVVHVHELASLPFTLLDICRTRKIPVVLTLHDYFHICPTVNFHDRSGAFCSGATAMRCVRCCMDGSDGGWGDRLRTLRIEKGGRLPAVAATVRFLFHTSICRILSRVRPPKKLALHYRRRLLENIERLRNVEVIIAQSNRVKEIYAAWTGRADIEVIHSTLPHIEALAPRCMDDDPKLPVRFATINGGAAPYKGSELIAGAVAILKDRNLESSYRLQLFGNLHRSIRHVLASPSVQWAGKFEPASLDRLLEGVDVGIVPSVCEEVYGYVGTEFLGKGIPVIGNRRGGITDYTLPGKTGWLNESCTAVELADIMEGIIRKPRTIVPLNQWIRENRSAVVVGWHSHVEAILQRYRAAQPGTAEGV